jgi:hypothetical protein
VTSGEKVLEVSRYAESSYSAERRPNFGGELLRTSRVSTNRGCQLFVGGPQKIDFKLGIISTI